MKEYKGSYYEVGYKNHNGVVADRWDDIESAKQGCVTTWASQRFNGYENYDQVIFYNTWQRLVDDDGKLLVDNHSISFIEEIKVADYEEQIEAIKSEWN